jgi:DNA-binding NtrC family response regulator
VLVTGESGTGKDLVARLLHHWSGRATGPFVDVAAGSLGPPHGESELFGVERGAFPGADAQRLGLLEAASGGTLYLDQVADLDARLQAGLVRVLETGRISRVGGTQPMAVDVRVIASTTHDVARSLAQGRLREDFVHRINPIRIALPPLRERHVDIRPLAEYFLREFASGEPPQLTPAAVAALERYRWPGNVRELRNVLERAVLLCTRGVIDASDLPLGPEVGAGARATPTAPLSLEEVERRHIADVLERTGWHRARASVLLGISPKTLYRKIREYGFVPPDRGGDEEEEA